jgi:uncharacterized protein YjdB
MLKHGPKVYPFPSITFSTYEVSISVSPSSITLKEGDTKALSEFMVNIDHKASQDFTWQLISGEDKVKIDGNRLVAVKPGQTVLYAVAPGGHPRAAVSVTITAKTFSLTSLGFNKKNYPIKEGSTFDMYSQLIFNPSNASNKQVKWVSSNVDILQVDENGIITAKSKGHVKLTAISLEDTTIQATTTILVQHNPHYEEEEEESTGEYRW